MFRRHQTRIIKNLKRINPFYNEVIRMKKGLFQKNFLNSPVDYIMILLYNEKGYFFYEN